MPGFFSIPRPASLTESELLDAIGQWDEHVPIPLDHELVPAAIRAGVEARWEPGDSLHRVPTRDGVEWWLLDADGQLVEAFWLGD